MIRASSDGSSGDPRLIIVVFMTYVIFFLLPTGDPAVRLAGKARTPEILAQIREHDGLDHPWYVQYLLFLKRAVLGDQEPVGPGSEYPSRRRSR